MAYLVVAGYLVASIAKLFFRDPLMGRRIAWSVAMIGLIWLSAGSVDSGVVGLLTAAYLFGVFALTDEFTRELR